MELTFKTSEQKFNNEPATSAITIILASYAYTRLANDADVVAALANHPNISIGK